MDCVSYPNLYYQLTPVFIRSIRMEPYETIKAPAQCDECKIIYQSPTTGVVGNRCHCGGILHTIQGK